MQITPYGRFLPIACTLLVATSASQGAVLIGKNVNNGDFTTTNLNAEVTSIPGWTVASGGTFVAAPYDSPRSDGPFGAASGGASLFLHSNGGTILRSNATILLTNGDSVTLAYDYSTPEVPTNLSFTLYQGGVFAGTLYSTSTGPVAAGFQLEETTFVFTGATGDYNFAINYNPGGASSDIGFDRLHVSAVPETSSALLLGGGFLAAMLRRKRRTA